MIHRIFSFLRSCTCSMSNLYCNLSVFSVSIPLSFIHLLLFFIWTPVLTFRIPHFPANVHTFYKHLFFLLGDFLLLSFSAETRPCSGYTSLQSSFPVCSIVKADIRNPLRYLLIPVSIPLFRAPRTWSGECLSAFNQKQASLRCISAHSKSPVLLSFFNFSTIPVPAIFL